VGRRVSCCRKEGLPGPELVRVNIQMLWSKASEGVFSPDSEEEKGRNSGKKRSGVAQVRECLPSKGKAQVQTPVLPKKKKKVTFSLLCRQNVAHGDCDSVLEFFYSPWPSKSWFFSDPSTREQLSVRSSHWAQPQQDK
jgi:hypothetical protein